MEQRNYKKEEQSYRLRATSYQLIILILLTITISSCDSTNKPEKDGFWKHIGGLPNTISIVFASNGDILSCSSLLIYLSTNNGDTWVETGRNYSDIKVINLSISGYLFAGTIFGLVRSTDGGKSWVQLNDKYISSILITASGEIYFGERYWSLSRYYRGVYYSSDNGDTWIEKSNGLPDSIVVSSLVLGADGTLYAGTANTYAGTATTGVYRSTDGGDTWLPPSNYIRAQINDLTISDDGSIFAATDIIPGVLKSTDKGVTWDQVKVNTGFSVQSARAITYNPITRDIFVLFTNNQIYKSNDLGVNWDLIEDSGLANTYPTNAIIKINTLTVNPNTGQMYVATNNGVYCSRNYP